MSKLIAKIKDNDSNGDKSSKHHHSLSNIFHLHTDSAGSEESTVKSITRKTRSRSNSLNKGGNGAASHSGATPSYATHRASRSNRHSLNSTTGATANDRLRSSVSPLPNPLIKSQSMDHSLSLTSQPYSAISSNVGDISISNTMSASIPRSTSTPLIHVGNDQSNTSLQDSNSPQPFPSVESPTEAAPPSKHSNGFFSTMLSAISSPVPHESQTDEEKDKDHGTSISATNSHTNNNNNNHNTSFSSKLDFLLKPAKFGKSKSSLPEDGQTAGDKSEETNSISDGRAAVSDNESKSFIGEDVPSTSNVHFESIRESPLQTLGTGNLSLHIFEKNNNSSLKNGPDYKRNDNTISFSSADANGESTSRAQSTSSRNHSTEKIDQLLAHNDNLKRNLSPNAVNKLLPLKNQLAVSGTADNKKVRRKSFSTDGPGSTKALDEDSDDSFSFDENENNNANQNQNGSFQDIGIQDYSDFKYASKKRNKEFHQNFKEVPRSERLIDDFSCAVSRDILVQGRIYLSPGYVCFNSNILGWVTNIIIPLQEVIQIEKKTTAVLFPNGMVIRTLHQKYVFATFISRDSFFSLITNVWHRVLLEGNEIDPSKLRKRMNTSVSSRRTKLSDEDSYSSDDDEYDEEEEDDEIHAKLENDVDVDTSGIVDSDEDITNNTNGAPQKENPSDGNAAVADTSNGDSYKGLPIIGPSTHAPTENGYEKSPNDTFICDETLEAPMGAIFRILFGDGTDKYITILKEQKNFDITESSITAISNNNKERKYSYIKPLGGSIGPKQTKCNITDTLIDFSIDSSILVEQVSRTPDVPSGSSFSVKTKIYLSWAPNNATKIYVVTSIEWTAKSWIKGAIEKGSIDGQKESMKSMMATLNKFIKTAQSSSAGSSSANVDKKKKKKRRSTVKQEDAPVIEKQEPEPPKTIINQIYDLFASVGDSVPISIPFVNSASAGFVYTVILYLVISSLGSMLLHLVGFGGSSSSSYRIGSGNMQSPDDFISRIKINGNEYSIVQTVDSTLSNGRLARNTEISMWEWIRDRSEGKIDLNESGSSKHDLKPINWSSDYSNLERKYSKDDIEEMLAMTRMKLDEIQQQISKSESSV
ncbi:hypothetical protein CLIB1423_05S00870 [[Candida] railenensis]|uniref:VASt domain-containing protein n=1 Tax=[Candida] railenensis TaxID=45579 RepID=A0A9P0QNB0_9ASCO|nr:hypothetical protein CLIB1423_05S00870 [[Candida] railenensis]